MLRLTTSVLVLSAAAALSACAKGPDSIAPVSMGNAFAAMDCRQAAGDLQVARQNVETLSSAQRGAVAGDAIGVFLLGIPVGSLTGGDKAGELGAEKGKVLALEARMRSC